MNFSVLYISFINITVIYFLSFSLDRNITLHKYTPESAPKTIIITVFLVEHIVTLGYISKTALQKFSKHEKFKTL